MPQYYVNAEVYAMNEIMNFGNPKDALEWATIISKTRFCPKEFFDRPHDVLIAIAYGSELGLKPLQALQNICVINGKPSIWGDAMLAVCKNHPDFEYIKEHFSEDSECAFCEIKRKNQPEVRVIFNKQMAIGAGLWNKIGPWKQYPARMLQMRARSFALRDCFPDVLKGLIAAEEAQDYKVEKEVTPAETLHSKLARLLVEKNISEEQINIWKEKYKIQEIWELSAELKVKLITYLESKEDTNNGV